MFSSPLPAPWVKKKTLFGVSGFTAGMTAFLVFGAGNTSYFMNDGIQALFIQPGSSLQGNITPPALSGSGDVEMGGQCDDTDMFKTTSASGAKATTN